MYSVVAFTHEPEYVKAFLALPKKLYERRFLTQRFAEEENILAGTHALSHYFSVHPFLLMSDGEVAARCLVTIYPNDPCAYLGFFESQDDLAGAALLFKAAEKFAQSAGCTKVVGPVNSSFWLSYRLKIDHFQEPYLQEPYNKPYYLQLFLDNGYAISDTWVSNSYNRPRFFENRFKKYEKRLKDFKQKGYIIRNVTAREYDERIVDLHELLMPLYSSFPIFKELSLDDFIAQFKDYKLAFDFHFVKLVYRDDELVGFFVGMPDYGTLLYGDLTWKTIARILLKKIRSSNYVMMYMGVKPGHLGLGRALAYATMKDLRIRRARSIGAFVKKDKVTEFFGAEMLDHQYHYVLLDKTLR